MEIKMNQIKQIRKRFDMAYHKGEYRKCIIYGNELVELYQKDTIRYAKEYGGALHNLALVLEKSYFYQSAIETYEKCAFVKKEYGGESITYADTLNNLGILFYQLHEFEKGIAIHEEVLEIRKRKLGRKHFDTIYTAHHIGKAYMIQERYQEAFWYYEKAVRYMNMMEQVPLKQLINLYMNMAKILEILGNHRKAIQYYDTVYMGLNEQKNHNNLMSSVYLEEIAQFYEKSGFIEYAFQAYKKSIQMKKIVMKSKTLDLMHSYYRFGDLCVEHGFYNDGLKNYKEALGIVLDLFDESHLYYNEILGSISLAYAQKKDFKKALQYTQKIMEHTIIYHNENPIQKVKNYDILAQILYQMKDFKGAFMWVQTALCTLEEVSLQDSESEVEVGIFILLADIYLSMGLKYASVMSMKEAIFQMEERYGVEDERPYINLYFLLANIYADCKKFEESLSVLWKIEKIILKHYGTDHLIYSNILKVYGEVYEKSGDYLQAQHHLQGALMMERTLLDSKSTIYIQTLYDCGKLAYKIGRYEQAKRLFLENQKWNAQRSIEDKNKTTVSILYIALCYLQQNNQKEAQIHYHQAVHIQEKNPFPESREYQNLNMQYLEYYHNQNMITLDEPNKSMKKTDCIEWIGYLQEQCDALELEYEETNIHKTTLLIALGEFHFMIEEYEKAYQYFIESTTTSSDKQHIICCLLAGKTAYKLGVYEIAIQALLDAKNSIEEYDTMQNEIYLPIIYTLALCHKGKGEVSESLQIYASWNELYLNTKSPIDILYMKRLEEWANYYFENEKYKSALEQYGLLIKLQKHTMQISLKEFIYMLKMTHIYFILENKGASLEILNQCFKKLKQVDQVSDGNYHFIYDKVGCLYMLLGFEREAFEALLVAYNRHFNIGKKMSKEGISFLLSILKKYGREKEYISVKKGEKILT